MESEHTLETEMIIGPSAIDAYSRLSYTMWYALAEFIDNSTQSRENYGNLINEVLEQEGTTLVVTITHDRINRNIIIEDNSIGMTCNDLIAGLKIATPTPDSRGRSKYGMGMKTASCWIGKKWKVITCEWGSGEEWTAEVDVKEIAYSGKKVQLTKKNVSADDHYTRIEIHDLRRNIQKRTEETIRWYLGSIYRFDINSENLKIVYNDLEVPPPDENLFATDPEGKPLKMDLPEMKINGKSVSGWVGVLEKGGRKFGGFSLFKARRQVQGFPNAWKPRSIFGGIEDEGANNLVSQRLTGLIELNEFEVSHTKDAILFQDDEEEKLENFLTDFTKQYRNFAITRRSRTGSPWAKEKVQELVRAMKKEFSSPEIKDTIKTGVLPPLDSIIKSNQKLLQKVTEEDEIETFEITDSLRIKVFLKETSEYEPYLTIASGASAGEIMVLINGLHPYYCALDSTDSIDECIRQFIYDALAEYKVKMQESTVSPDSVRRIKDELLRNKFVNEENTTIQ